MNMNQIKSAVDELRDQLTNLDMVQQKQLDDLETLLDQFKQQMNDATIHARDPQACSIGLECSSNYDESTDTIVGNTRYWVKPRIDKHNRDLYNEIYSWCEDTFKPGVWFGDKELQMYWFDHEEDRDWFVVRWS